MDKEQLNQEKNSEMSGGALGSAQLFLKEHYKTLGELKQRGILGSELYGGAHPNLSEERSLLYDVNKPLRGAVWYGFLNNLSFLDDSASDVDETAQLMEVSHRVLANDEDLEVMDLDIKRLLLYNIYEREQECRDIEKILYNYCKQNGQMYKQGMHELAGVMYMQMRGIFYNGNGVITPSLETVYVGFNNYMNLQQFSFDEVELFNFKNFHFEPMLQASFPSISRCLDSKHKLNNMLWLLRWLRLCFLREFEELDHLLIIWDHLIMQNDNTSLKKSQQKYQSFMTFLLIIFLVYRSKEIIYKCQDQSELLHLFFHFFNTKFFHKKRLQAILECCNGLVEGKDLNGGAELPNTTDIRNAIKKLVCNDGETSKDLDMDWFHMFFEIHDYNRLKLQQRLKDKFKS
ncbi:hypothetical protein ACO0RG_000883 [Hanseniaspora osmophila]